MNSNTINTTTTKKSYRFIGAFSNKLAQVESIEVPVRWGYINETGDEVIPCQYIYAGTFSDGLAAVKKDGKCGYIDTTGAEVVPCIYDGADCFINGIAWVQLEGVWMQINKLGKIIRRNKK